MLMAQNTKNYDHKRAYGLDNIVMDANYNQVERAKVDINNVSSMIRFSYTESKEVVIESFEEITVKQVTTKNFAYSDDAPGVLFLGKLSSSKVVSKKMAAEFYPDVFNKLVHFKQFTIKWLT